VDDGVGLVGLSAGTLLTRSGIHPRGPLSLLSMTHTSCFFSCAPSTLLLCAKIRNWTQWCEDPYSHQAAWYTPICVFSLFPFFLPYGWFGPPEACRGRHLRRPPPPLVVFFFCTEVVKLPLRFGVAFPPLHAVLPVVFFYRRYSPVECPCDCPFLQIPWIVRPSGFRSSIS